MTGVFMLSIGEMCVFPAKRLIDIWWCRVLVARNVDKKLNSAKGMKFQKVPSIIMSEMTWLIDDSLEWAWKRNDFWSRFGQFWCESYKICAVRVHLFGLSYRWIIHSIFLLHKTGMKTIINIQTLRYKLF